MAKMKLSETSNAPKPTRTGDKTSRVQYDGPFSGKCIPQEVNDYILDFLWDDRITLKLCSLTCRRWLPASRYHLFRSVRIRSSEDCRRFRKLLDTSKSLALVDLTNYIRQLIFQDLPFRGLDAARIGRSFSKLRRVECLELCFWPAEDLPVDLIKNFSRAFPKIKALRLKDMSFKHDEDFLRLLSSFPKLSDVHIEDPKDSTSLQSTASLSEVRYVDLCPDGAPDLHAKLVGEVDKAVKIEKLELVHPVHGVSIAEWVSQPPFQLHVRQLRLHWNTSPESLAGMAQLVERVGPAVEQLDLAFAGHSDAHRALLLKGLGHLQVGSLKSLIIGPVHLTDDRAWIPFVLGHLRSQAEALMHIRIRLAVGPNLEDLAWFNLEMLDEVLLELVHKLPSLEVTFEILDEHRSGVHKASASDLHRALTDRLTRLSDACEGTCTGQDEPGQSVLGCVTFCIPNNEQEKGASDVPSPSPSK